MRSTFYSILATLTVAVLLLTENATAMNSNLALPYNDTASGPQTPYLSFHSPQSADLLFSPALLPPGQPRLRSSVRPACARSA